MNQKVLRTLEYNKIVERLAEYAFGADTKERFLPPASQRLSMHSSRLRMP